MAEWVKQLKELLVECGDFEMSKGVSEEEIVLAQKELGVRFPKGYVTYLREIGCLKVGEYTLYGLGSDVHHFYELVRQTLSERNDMCPSIPPQLLPILNDGWGNHYCLDTTQGNEEDCPVVF